MATIAIQDQLIDTTGNGRASIAIEHDRMGAPMVSAHAADPAGGIIVYCRLDDLVAIVETAMTMARQLAAAEAAAAGVAALASGSQGPLPSPSPIPYPITTTRMEGTPMTETNEELDRLYRAVDTFSDAMKGALSKGWEEGKKGWDEPVTAVLNAPERALEILLRAKQDIDRENWDDVAERLVDVANYVMFAHKAIVENYE